MVEANLIDERMRSQLSEVSLIVLFGSRAKGSATERSDWDVAVAKAPDTYTGMQFFVLQQKLAELLEIPFDKIDLIDLRTASPLLGFAIAREGEPLYEAMPGLFRRFQVKASKMYADTAKLRQLQREYIRSGL